MIPRENFFEFKPDRGTRGHKYQLRLRSVPNYDAVKYFFAYRIVSLWNSLPESAVNATNVEQFTNQIPGDFLRSQCKYVYR